MDRAVGLSKSIDRVSISMHEFLIFFFRRLSTAQACEGCYVGLRVFILYTTVFRWNKSFFCEQKRWVSKFLRYENIEYRF
jgi:hypothetical protein